MAMKYYTIKSSLLNYCKQTKSCEQFKYPIFTYKSIFFIHVNIPKSNRLDVNKNYEKPHKFF